MVTGKAVRARDIPAGYRVQTAGSIHLWLSFWEVNTFNDQHQARRQHGDREEGEGRRVRRRSAWSGSDRAEVIETTDPDSMVVAVRVTVLVFVMVSRFHRNCHFTFGM